MNLASGDWREKRAFSLTKSRCRVPESPSFGGYMLVDPYRNAVVAGGDPWAFSLSLEEAESWVNDIE